MKENKKRCFGFAPGKEFYAEYHDKEWKIFYYDEHKHLLKDDEAEEIPEMDNSALLKIVIVL